MASYSPLRKILMICGLMLVLVGPLLMIQVKIDERQNRARLVSYEISNQFAKEQTLVGPLLMVPRVREYWATESTRDATEEEAVSPRRKLRRDLDRYLPDTLDIQGNLQSRMLYRGIYGTPVYQSVIELEARFPAEWLQAAKADASIVSSGTPLLVFRVGDLRGLVERPALRIGERTLPLVEPASMPSVLQGGGVVAAPLPGDLSGPFTVRLRLNLNGSTSLAALPMAKETRMTLRGDWPHPSFSGLMLPAEREVSEDGFIGRWQTNSLAASSAIDCLQSDGHCRDDSQLLRVDLVQPVTGLLSSERALKYSFLIVGLTFAAFFLFEVMRRVAMHPMQYLLVGLALAMFYLLLVALGEHVDFVWAYVSGAVACVGLIGVYLSAVLKSKLAGWGFALAQLIVLGLLFGILMAEDYALLMGSLLLFAALAAVMILTRRVDWHGLAQRGGTSS